MSSPKDFDVLDIAASEMNTIQVGSINLEQPHNGRIRILPVHGAFPGGVIEISVRRDILDRCP